MKIRSVFLFSILIGISNLLNCQVKEYDVSLIPDSLKKDVKSIVRKSLIELEITAPGNAVKTVTRAITVLNKENENEFLLRLFTDKFVKPDDIDITIFDSRGKETGRLKKKDLQTVSAYDGISLVTDNQLLFGRPKIEAFPATVEYNYKEKYSGFIDIDDFYLNSSRSSCQTDKYTIIVKKDNDIRYKNYKTDMLPVVVENDNTKTYTWQISNTKPFDIEEGMSSDDIPQIKIAPTKFKIDGYEGNMTTWEDFGKWSSKLIEGTNILSEGKVKELNNMVKDAKTDIGKARILYSYLQKNFRYVSIQLGIGGWKPFSAEYVDKNKYGDCKALTNYMQTCLKYVGVKSYYAIINAGYDEMPVDAEFPQSAFNHIILCIPEKGDTTWLECTNQTIGFGELGNFTANRNALLVTENGGVMVSTPKSKSSDNIMNTVATVTVDDDLSGIAEATIVTKGAYKRLINYILNEKRDDQKESIVYYLGYKQPDDFEFSKMEESDLHKVSLRMSFSKIPEFNSGNKLFLSPQTTKNNFKLPKPEKRKFDYFFEDPFEKNDTTIYKMPQGSAADALPKEKELKCKYATYHTSYWYDEKQSSVYSTSSLKLFQHRIPAADYAEVKTFFDSVMQDAAQRIVVKKGDGIKKEIEKKPF